MPASSTRRTELGDFLRTRRERLTPEMVGLPPGGRRRTPGLRREEVALLAGVGVTWYTWLEQGRNINASAQVIEAIARSLQMDQQERWHLFQLAGVTVVPPSSCTGITAAAQAVLDQLDPFPAAIVSPRFDVRGYNRAYNRMMGDLDAMPPEQRNTAWLFFVGDTARRFCLGNRAQAGAHMVATLRAAMTQHVDDPLWRELVARLRRSSAEFDEHWRRHDVTRDADIDKDFDTPVGVLRLQVAKFTTGDSGQGGRLTVYTPRDAVTHVRLTELVEYDATHRAAAVPAPVLEAAVS
jgi:transcriptional regulator with XRE-family HTH domain